MVKKYCGEDLPLFCQKYIKSLGIIGLGIDLKFWGNRMIWANIQQIWANIQQREAKNLQKYRTACADHKSLVSGVTLDGNSLSLTLLFCSGFFGYLYASPHQKNICKFTLCRVFQLVLHSLRNVVIIIYFPSVKAMFLYCHCHCWSSNIDFKCVRITSWSLQ